MPENGQEIGSGAKPKNPIDVDESLQQIPYHDPLKENKGKILAVAGTVLALGAGAFAIAHFTGGGGEGSSGESEAPAQTTITNPSSQADTLPPTPPASFDPQGSDFNQIYTKVRKKNDVFTVSTNVNRALITNPPAEGVVVEEMSMGYGSCFDSNETMSPAKSTPAILITDSKGGGNAQFTEISPTPQEMTALENARLQYLWNTEQRGKDPAEIVLPTEKALSSVAVALSGISCAVPGADAARPIVDDVTIISRGGIEQSESGDQNDGGFNFFLVAGIVIALGYGVKKTCN